MTGKVEAWKKQVMEAATNAIKEAEKETGNSFPLPLSKFMVELIGDTAEQSYSAGWDARNKRGDKK